MDGEANLIFNAAVKSVPRYDMILFIDENSNMEGIINEAGMDGESSHAD